MATYYLQAPLKEEDVTQLKLGDLVYISGMAFTCRSRLHRYIFDEGNTMPEVTKDENVLIHVGPIMVKEEDKWRLVSFMPTSSIRFEKWGAKSVENWGLHMIIGKTTMGEETMTLSAVTVAPSKFAENLPTWDAKTESVQFHGGWTMGVWA